ncbi:MAG: ATP-binding protein [Magnetococcus sp. DMHC-8]
MDIDPPRSSLRRKITLGYVAVSGLILTIALLAMLEQYQMESHFQVVSTVADFLDAVLETRRYEKNFFLYNQETDWVANRQWLASARRIFAEQMRNLDAVQPMVHDLERNLAEYGQAMGHPASAGQSDPLPSADREERVRHIGKELVTAAEGVARSEKQRLVHSLALHRQVFLVGITLLALMVLALGQVLTRVVTLPLREMEQTMRQIADGRLDRIELPARDREIHSLTQAFNRMLMELKARQKQMVRSEKLASLGTMLSGVAHELNNPLSNIATSCQILLEETPEEGWHRELLTQIDSQSMRARDIIRSLLDFARDQPFRRQPIPLDLLVEETLRLLSTHLLPGVSVVRHVTRHLLVEADHQRLQQALLNLIKNALDALAGSGEIIIAGQALFHPLVVSVDQPHRLVAGQMHACTRGPVTEILIQDNGMGIDPFLLPRILDPFFTTKETGQGSGLGLFVVHEIVEEHGGCLVIDSQPGNGSSFRLYLPCPSLSPAERDA